MRAEARETETYYPSNTQQQLWNKIKNRHTIFCQKFSTIESVSVQLLTTNDYDTTNGYDQRIPLYISNAKTF